MGTTLAQAYVQVIPTTKGIKEGQELLNVLNATNTYTGVNETTLKNNYIIAQYLDPQTGKAKNGTFFPSDRKVEKYPNGMYKSVSVTLTEV